MPSARNLKKDPEEDPETEERRFPTTRIPDPRRVSLTSLSCYPPISSSTRGDPPCSLPPRVILRVLLLFLLLRLLLLLLRAKTTTRSLAGSRKFHPRIAQLIPRSFLRQPRGRGAATTPLLMCTLEARHVLIRVGHPSSLILSFSSTDLFLPPTSLCRRQRDKKTRLRLFKFLGVKFRLKNRATIGHSNSSDFSLL